MLSQEQVQEFLRKLGIPSDPRPETDPERWYFKRREQEANRAVIIRSDSVTQCVVPEETSARLE